MEDGIGEDRISELPEPILHHIQSLLELKEAARTSALSGIWNTVWSTLPFLNFDGNFFLAENRNAKTQELITLIDKTLNHRKTQGIRIEKFGLSARLGNNLDLSGHLDRWIDCLTLCNMKELNIELYNSSLSQLPPSLFTIVSLTSMTLKHCKFLCPAVEKIKLPNLRKLILKHVNVDDHLIRHLISTCHLLEYLLVQCNTGKHKILTTKHVPNVEVETSNLHELAVYHIGHPPRISPAYDSLKCLTLYWVVVKDEAWFSCLIPNLLGLETLSLDEIFLNTLRISSPSLKHLNLCRPRRVFEAEIDTPYLQNFRYGGYVLNFLLKNNLAVGVVEILISESSIDGDESVKLIQLLRKFNYSEVVKLSAPYFTISREMRDKLLSPLPNVNHFICWRNIPSSTPHVIDAVSQVLDGTLWLSNCPESLFISVDSKFNGICLKLVYEDELTDDKDNKSCRHCDFIPFRCWQHSLKTVEIEKTRGSERVGNAVRSIKYYFMANKRFTSESDVSSLFVERWVNTISFPTGYY